jgi:hypothetical protein
MQATITAKARIEHKPMVRFCDNTGKRLTQEQMDAQAKSAYRGRLLIEIFVGERKLVEFKVVAFEGKSELYARMPQEDAGTAGKRDAFNLDVTETETILKLALHALRTEKTEQVEL